MKFERRFTLPDAPVAEQIEWEVREASIPGAGFRMDVEIPCGWSQDATNILAQKYLRKAGVPSNFKVYFEPEQRDMPAWLCRSVPNPHKDTTYGPETSARQVFHRMAGCWTYWGWREGYFGVDKKSARAFYDEIFWMLAHQMAAPNSPQWFNSGLHWAYGIEGPDVGQWAIIKDYPIADGGQVADVVDRVYSSYERPQPHACFLTPTADNLVGPDGIMDTWSREARIFKQGSGSGINASAWRAKGEKLSGGGRASGVMSWLRIGDSAAGAIQSGGTTRRAAKMVALDADHPEIEAFVDWKVEEEYKAATMYIGSQLLRKYYLELEANRDPMIIIPSAVINRMKEGFVPEILGIGWEGEAIRTVDGQNSNNSVRMTDEFLSCVDRDAEWCLTNRTNGEVVKRIQARAQWDRICRSAWACADPGLLYHTTINAWNTCPHDGEIRTTNPCSEFHFLDGSACDLASLNLCKFLGDQEKFDCAAFEHACRLWTVVLDISVSMAGFPAREFAEGARNYRTLGLGYANLGGLLLSLDLSYDGEAGRALAAGVTALMTGVAYQTSAEMADELGPFPRWEANKEHMKRVLLQHKNGLTGFRAGDAKINVTPPFIDISKFFPEIHDTATQIWDDVKDAESFRNAQVTLLAPTGTISLVMDCDTSGIEPYFNRSSVKQLAGGGTMEFASDVPEAECAVPSRPGGPCLAPESHVKMVAAVQPFLSGGVSKTVNLPHSATPADVDRTYRLAHRLGLKSISIYRDGSKLSQPLSVAIADGDRNHQPPLASLRAAREVLFSQDTPGPQLHRGEREQLPARRRGWTQKVSIGGQSIYLRTGEHKDGRLAEVFLDYSKEGSTTRALLGCLAKAVSIAIQYGTPLEALVKAFVHTRFEPSGVVRGDDRVKLCSSLADYVFRRLGVEYLGRDDLAHVPADDAVAMVAEVAERLGLDLARTTHEAPEMVMMGEECPECRAWGRMRRTGTCVTCEACGWNQGCG